MWSIARPGFRRAEPTDDFCAAASEHPRLYSLWPHTLGLPDSAKSALETGLTRLARVRINPLRSPGYDDIAPSVTIPLDPADPGRGNRFEPRGSAAK